MNETNCNTKFFSLSNVMGLSKRIEIAWCLEGDLTSNPWSISWLGYTTDGPTSQIPFFVCFFVCLFVCFCFELATLKQKKKKKKKKPLLSSDGVTPVFEMYETRACIFCGVIIHHTAHCKMMTCIHCKKTFCFVCLSPKDRCPVPANWTYCNLAPIQSTFSFLFFLFFLFFFFFFFSFCSFCSYFYLFL